MSATSREALVRCLDEQGRVAGVLRLVQADRRPDSIRILTLGEARQHGEEEIQLLEGRGYDFELLEGRGRLRLQVNGVVKPSSIRPEIGRIETGVETGLLPLVLEDAQTGAPVARGAVEVLSTKINYREDYRGMLNFIAGECSELLFDIRANSRMRLGPKFKTEPQNLQRQLEFLSSELNSSSFLSALQRVMAMPHQRLETQWENRSVSRLRRGGRDLARQVCGASSRVSLPADNPIARMMTALGISEPSLPAKLSVRRQADSRDTPENRFVKYVLSHFRDFLKRIESVLEQNNTEDRQRIVRNVQHLQDYLNERLSCEFFKGISAPQVLPMGSPVLQRKSGYREILLTWLKFDIASQLAWKGGDDVYGAGKRDMTTLYEYWLFFQLLRLFRDKFVLAVPPARSLFEQTEAGLNLRLKVNEPLGIQGRCQRESRRLEVRFHYNLTHERSEARSDAGSWTRRMRPDFTLSFWPEGFSLEEAEAQELAVHIHFDAKYRVESITELFGGADDDLSEEKNQQKRGHYKRADLLKMHAYRDAIRRSEGAYILYPGDKSSPTRFHGFHEILPGLGAFAVKPGPSGEAVGLQHLSRFVDEVITHVCNRATAREQSSYHRFAVYREDEATGGARIASPLPEKDAVENVRPVPPAEHSVLVGWCENERQLEWTRRTGLYNFRAGFRRGSIRLQPAIADARHLLLHTPGGKALPGLWRIMKRGPRIFTGEELLRNGYLDDKARQGTSPRKREWEKNNPPHQKFTKTDLAKFEHAWVGQPHLVCLGAEKNFVKFAERMEDDGEPLVDRDGNVGEASKKAECWEGFRKQKVELDDSWKTELASQPFVAPRSEEEALAGEWEKLRHAFMADARTIEGLEAFSGKEWIRTRRRDLVASYAALTWDQLRLRPGLGLKKIRGLVEMLAIAREA